MLLGIKMNLGLCKTKMPEAYSLRDKMRYREKGQELKQTVCIVWFEVWLLQGPKCNVTFLPLI